jgi:hypothetical protein
MPERMRPADYLRSASEEDRQLIDQLRIEDTWLDPAMWMSFADCLWPTPALRSVPGADLAHRAADLIVAVNKGRRDPVDYCKSLGIRVLYRTLAAETSGSGIEALLIPDSGHTFEVVCDPWVDVAQGQSEIQRRIAHELGHTLFYNWEADPPKHAILMPSNAEEAFCDAFSASLTGLPPRVRHN